MKSGSTAYIGVRAQLTILVALPAAAFFIASSAGYCPKQFSSGDAVFNAFEPQSGLPELHLENGHSDHVLIKLTHGDTDRTHLYFVEGRKPSTIRFVTSGMYKLSFAVGGTLASDCISVRSAETVLEFTEPFELTRTEALAPIGADFAMDVTIRDAWATLYEGEGGEANARSISLNEFNR